MANLNQFYKNEIIKITVTPDDVSSFVSPRMYIYRDTLDLKQPGNAVEVIKLWPTGTPTEVDLTEEYVITVDDTEIGSVLYSFAEAGDDNPSMAIFSIYPAKTKDMEAGDYTLELEYGTDPEIVIVRTNHAFTLVESGSELKNRQ